MSESVDTEVENEIEQVAEQEVVETPDSGYIDFNEIEDPKLRAKVEMRTKADFRKLKEKEAKEQEWQRKEREYQEKLRKLEEQTLEYQKPQETQPPSPDLWYKDEEAAKAQQEKYNQYVQKKAEWEYNQKMRQSQLQAETEREKQERLGQFAERAKNAGFEIPQMISAANILDKALPAETQAFILEHPYAPQLMNQLASNPMELQTVANLSPYQVGVKLNEMAKAFQTKKTSDAPPPDDPLGGSGVKLDDDYGGLLKGGSFL